MEIHTPFDDKIPEQLRRLPQLAYNLWWSWTPEARARYFTYLQQPLHGRHFMMGDQISYHPGWQEGAFSSAHHALTLLQGRVRAELAAA